MNPDANVADTPSPSGLSLRAKGLIATLALLAYLLGSVVYVSIERAKIYDSIQALQQLSRHDKALALTEAAVNGAVIDVSEASNAGQGEPGLPGEIVLYMEACAKLFAALDEFDPGYALLQRAVVRSYESLKVAPVRANWIDLRESLARAADELEIRRRTLSDRRDALTSSYQRQYDTVTIESLALALFGFAVFGSMVAWFFARLSSDIRALEQHARHIVRGSRGVALSVRRDDELGSLMHAVNHMSADLDEREKQIELDGQRRSHQDKMLAVGALAAGFAHEVNNPLAVISGVAQELRANPGGVDAAALAESARLIQAQAQRASQAARQLAEAAAPHAQALDWVDLNAVVRRVVQLMGYDRRYRQIALRVDIDPALPAVRVSADAVQQVLMQVMSLGFDALVAPGAPATTEPATVGTSRAGDRVEISLGFPTHVDYSREEVQRCLLLSRAVIEPLRGQLALAQDEAPRLHIKLTLPVDGGGR
jgi:two-component system, NtrC family, sensor kinase